MRSVAADRAEGLDSLGVVIGVGHRTSVNLGNFISRSLVSLSLDKVKSVGADLVITYRTPIDGLTFGFAGNINETTASDLDPVLVAQVDSLREGKQLPYTPKWSYNTYLSLVRPLSDTLDFSAYASWTRVGSQLGSANVTSPSTSDVSLRLGVKSERWSVTLFGENLADQRRPAAIRSMTTQTRRDPRTLGIELGLRY